MELLQIREKEILETLKQTKSSNFVLIGGYAVNAYTLPRFSVDCDLVVKDLKEANEISTTLKKLNYTIKAKDDKFLAFEKKIELNFRVTVDILIKGVYDKSNKSNFSAEWVFENSNLINLKGKTFNEELKLRIINIDALIVMKIMACRNTDIRDIFMLFPKAKDIKWIKEEISKRSNFENLIMKIKEKITSKQFRDNLQGIYGYVDEKTFEKHKNAVLNLI